jgi:cytochrome P450
MMDPAPIAAEPILAGALPPQARTRAERKRQRREAPFPGLTARAFEADVLTGRTVFGAWALINDPAGVRRVLVENAANYPKTRFDIRFFAAAFGGGLLGSEGEVWRRHRKVMIPAFHPRSVAAYGPAMAATAQAFLERWDALPDGAPVDMALEMTALTHQVIARTVFSIDSGEIIALLADALARSLDAGGEASLLDVLPVIGDWILDRRARRVARQSGPLDAAVAELVRGRESDLAAAPNDLLTRLVAAKDEGGGGLSAKEIRDEIVTIFVAGHDTTANTLAWTFYLLAQRPAIAKRLHDELDAVLGDRTPTADDLAALPFARQVIEESMRLYPAVPGLSTRRALAEDEVCGTKIPRGATVSILPWVVHRRRKLWDEPERFDPDRFTPERSAGRPRFAYLPFGGGPRVCIGQVLAMNESILILAALAQRYAPELDPQAIVVPRANVTLQFRHGLAMRLRRRAGS